MSGALIAGFICVALFVRFCMSASDYGQAIDTDNADDFTEIPLPVFKHLIVDRPDNNGSVEIGQLRGVKLEESDSIASPFIRSVAALAPVFKTRFEGDTLRLGFDFDDVEIIDTNSGKRYVSSGSGMAATLVVPRGMLKSVDSDWQKLRLYGFSTSELAVAETRDISLHSCKIGRLDFMERQHGLNELTLVDSSLGVVTIEGGSFKIDCSKCSGLIDKLIINGKNQSFNNVNLTKANVDTTVWNPTDTLSRLSVNLVGPAEILKSKK